MTPDAIRTDCDKSPECFKINIFHIDWYTTKPGFSHDKIYSIYRQSNIKVATVLRIFGSTDNGLKVCLHMHQYFPHLSIRQVDLAALYGFTINEQCMVDELVDLFIRDLEIEIRRKLMRDSDSAQTEEQNETEPDEHYIYSVESYVSKPVYGFQQPQTFYRFSFYSTWAMESAKRLLQMGSINNFPLLPYNCLEFLLQFYIDSQTYLNTLHLKNVSFRKNQVFSKNLEINHEQTSLEKQKLDSLNIEIVFNEMSCSSTCLLECDVTMDDIVHLEHVKHFPMNLVHTPSLPGIIKLWNDQYFRHMKNGVNYEEFISILKDATKREAIITRKSKANNYILKMLADKKNISANKDVIVLPPFKTKISFDDNLDECSDDDEKVYYYEIDDEEFDQDEEAEMNCTLEELNLCSNDFASNPISRSLYHFDDPGPEELNGEKRQTNIPQLDGMDDRDLVFDRKSDEAINGKSNILCTFQHKKVKLSLDNFGRESIQMPRLSLTSLLSNRIVVNDELKQRLLLRCDESPKVEFSQKIELNKQENTKKALFLDQSIAPLTESTLVRGSPGWTSFHSATDCRGTIQTDKVCPPMNSTPKVSTWHGASTARSKRKNTSKHFCASSCEAILNHQPKHPEMSKENIKFILSQSSQIFNPGKDISSLISANSTDQSFDPLTLENVQLKWTRCLEMTLMSLEIHASTQNDLCPNPERDPIQIASFVVHSEVLNNSTAQSEGQLNFIHIGAIVVKPNFRLKREEIIVKHKAVQIEYVQSEVDLLLLLSSYTKIFDPDIFVGYQVDTLSWGYLLQRSLIVNIDPITGFSRITNRYQARNNSVGAANKPPQLSGRIVLNLWSLMRHEMAMRSYAFENVHYHLLKERVPKYSQDYLSTLWRDSIRSKDSLSERILLEYYLTRVESNIKMLCQLNLVSRTFDLSCLFGMRFEDVFNRGSQFRVESMLYPLLKLDNFVPIRFSKQRVSEQATPESIPLVLEPECSFHSEPVAVLDFQSLYPSVMIAHNYCFTTCLGKLNNIARSHPELGCNQLQVDYDLLGQLKNDVQISPNKVLFVKPNIRKGLLSKMLEDLIFTRILIKNELKLVCSHLAKAGLSCTLQRQLKNLKRQLEVCQLGLKLIANVSYGYTSANFSGRMPCVDVADSIVSKGREALERAIHLINCWGVRSGSGAKVIYGDTDSVFISFPGHTLEEAFQKADMISQEITKRNPYPMKIKLEKVYQPCLLLAKKRYCGNSFESTAQMRPSFDAKGIETIRRDNCNATSKILKKCIKILFESNGDLYQTKPYIQWQIKKILNGRLSNLNDFVFAKEFWGLKYYSNESLMPSCIIARQRLRHDPRAEPRTRERVPYIIVSGSAKDRLADLVRDPMELLFDRSLQINAPYYIERAIFPPLVRLLEALTDFASTILQEWYEEVRHFRASKLKLSTAPAESADKLKEFFQTSLCVLCQNRIVHHSENSLQYPLCVQCQQSSQRSIVLLKDRLWTAGQQFHQLARTCSICTGGGVQGRELYWPVGRHQCSALTCTYLFRYQQAAQDYQILSAVDQLVSGRINLSTNK